VLLDLRGTGCATVLIRLAATARTAAPDSAVTVWTDDRGAPSELPAWCRMTGHRYVGVHPTEHDQYELVLNPTASSGEQP
jgi:tRNA 2-thiouridine synthesizing protein A